jgi:5'-3' exonuclease
VKLYLLDGTYELFLAYYALPSLVAPDGRQVAAVRGLVQTLLTLLRQDEVTHVACAFDHVIESFRNDLFAGYKTGAGVPKELLGQFELAERAAASLGIVVWPMVEFEADDAIATATAR